MSDRVVEIAAFVAVQVSYVLFVLWLLSAGGAWQKPRRTTVLFLFSLAAVWGAVAQLGWSVKTFL